MTDRRPIVGGNWKMNTDVASAIDLAKGTAQATATFEDVDVVVCPPFTYLLAVRDALQGTRVALGAQDGYHAPNGAYTGEISLGMLKDCGCTWMLTGHSERRHVIGESNKLINQKTVAALEAGLRVILCVGETQTQREAGETDAVNETQLRAGLAGISADAMARVVIAYEPVWAIGTGLTATPADAQNAHHAIRNTLRDLYGDAVADATRIQYGGSVKPGNAAELFGQADIDGGLIGGAALKAADFAAIVSAASPAS